MTVTFINRIFKKMIEMRLVEKVKMRNNYRNSQCN